MKKFEVSMSDYKKYVYDIFEKKNNPKDIKVDDTIYLVELDDNKNKSVRIYKCILIHKSHYEDNNTIYFEAGDIIKKIKMSSVVYYHSEYILSKQKDIKHFIWEEERMKKMYQQYLVYKNIDYWEKEHYDIINDDEF